MWFGFNSLFHRGQFQASLWIRPHGSLSSDGSNLAELFILVVARSASLVFQHFFEANIKQGFHVVVHQYTNSINGILALTMVY